MSSPLGVSVYWALPVPLSLKGLKPPREASSCALHPGHSQQACATPVPSCELWEGERDCLYLTSCLSWPSAGPQEMELGQSKECWLPTSSPGNMPSRCSLRRGRGHL